MTVFVRAGAGLRVLRAAVFAAACVALAAAGHAWASGVSVPACALAAAWCAVFAVAAPMAGRERSLPGISVLLAGAQAVLHVMFSAGQWWCSGSGAPAAPAGGRGAAVVALAERLVCGGGGPVRLTPAGAAALVRRAGIDPSTLPAGGGAHAAGGAAAMTGMPGMAGSAMSFGWTMILGHAAAALLAGWLLRRGEAALWRLVRLSADVAGRLARRVPWAAWIAAVLALGRAAGTAPERVGAARGTRRERDGDGRPEQVCLRHAVVRRGPPRWALAA